MSNQVYTLADLTERVGGELHGDGRVTIRGVNTLSAAGPDQITWISDAKFLSQLRQSRAGAVLLPRELIPRGSGDAPIPAVRVDQVDQALAHLLGLFAPPVPQPASGIHPTAVVAETAGLGHDVAVGPHAVIEDGAEIGPGTRIYPGVHIGAETHIGRDCVLWNHAIVRERCHIGDRVILHPHVVIGSDGFGYYFADGRHNRIPHGGRVVIHDDVEIGAGTTIDRSKVGETVVGPGTKIDNLVQVGHNAQIGAHCILIALSGIGGSAVLGNGVVLGGRVGLRDNITLGDGVIVSACSCVAHDVPAGKVLGGTPAYDHNKYLRAHTVIQKLPDMARQVKVLADRVQKLEAADD